MYVEDSAMLASLVERLRKSEAVAIDTEFMREKTYYAKLCLIQIANDDEHAIIDPLMPGLDLTPLAALFADRAVTKVFHAGDQDLEILFRATGVVPAPLFDTQKAASILGMPQQVGYGALVKDMLDVVLPKGESFTDWARRPLSDKQLLYAADDVTYLIRVYHDMVDELTKAGRIDWVRRDFVAMEDPSKYTVDPREMWRKVKRCNSLNRHQLAVLREVAAWRELQAQKRDIPRRWLFSDESLIEVARRAPHTKQELAEIRGVGDRIRPNDAANIIEGIEAGESVPEEDLPRLPKRKAVNGDSGGIVDLLMALSRVRAKQNQVSPSTLVSRDDLAALASGTREGLDVLTGWRKEMVGDELVDLLDGKVSLRVKDSAIIVERD